MSVTDPDVVCCTVHEVLGRVGDKWSALTIARLGSGTQRFSRLRRDIDGISQRMLTVTLRNLERDGLVSRHVYPEVPPRVEYTLTDLGTSLHEAVLGLVQWSEDHTTDIQQARTRYDRTGEPARRP
ncbi:MAG: transcriptional regulator [Streptosporangiaceae bacterium]|jgi:DNA-binding HxlR family transcriptional regulator|nr:transcriptional regulator [Streptosporangiaceae bacterium]